MGAMAEEPGFVFYVFQIESYDVWNRWNKWLPRPSNSRMQAIAKTQPSGNPLSAWFERGIGGIKQSDSSRSILKQRHMLSKELKRAHNRRAQSRKPLN